MKLAPCLAALLALALAACDQIHPVSSATSAGPLGPGSASDGATGGQANNAPEGDHP